MPVMQLPTVKGRRGNDTRHEPLAWMVLFVQYALTRSSVCVNEGGSIRWTRGLKNWPDYDGCASLWENGLWGMLDCVRGIDMDV